MKLTKNRERNKRRKIKRKKQWVVSIDRPEEIYKHPWLYYTDEQIEKYAHSGGMRRTQERIANRIIELLNIKSGARILDLGCGVGYTTGAYKKRGYKVIGLDVLPKMLEKAKEKHLNVILGNIKNVSSIFKKEFDGVVSASALQWLTKSDLIKAAGGINSITKNNGKLVIQFYPKTEEIMMDTARIFKKHGFRGNIVIDNPGNPKKRVIYIVMKKEKKQDLKKL